MTTSELVQIILMGLLVVITGIYAWRTFAISNASKKQAKTSMRMAEEMKNQRYSESLPLLVPHIPPQWDTQGMEANEVPYKYLQTGIGIRVIWHNFGKGVAINLKFSFWGAPLPSGKASFFPPSESQTLEVGGKKEVDYSKILNDSQGKDISESYKPSLIAEYQDIYERDITTIQEFRIDKENERAFIGELYFTINGRRLGQEVAHND